MIETAQHVGAYLSANKLLVFERNEALSRMDVVRCSGP